MWIVRERRREDAPELAQFEPCVDLRVMGGSASIMEGMTGLEEMALDGVPERSHGDELVRLRALGL